MNMLKCRVCLVTVYFNWHTVLTISVYPTFSFQAFYFMATLAFSESTFISAVLIVASA